MARADLEDGGLMRLGLSSAAAPVAAIDDIVGACATRGLSAVELRAGDGHGIDPDNASASAVAELHAIASAANIVIAGFHVEDSSRAASLARLSQALDAPIIVADACDITERIDRAHGIVDAGGRALVLASGDASAWHAALATSGLDCAWQADGDCSDLPAAADLLLQHREPLLRYIRFIGGGPETAQQEGRGTGTLMGRLALAGYNGPVILAPSSTRYHIAWETWLGRRGGWGCGGRSSAAELVHLPVETATGGAE